MVWQCGTAITGRRCPRRFNCPMSIGAIKESLFRTGADDVPQMSRVLGVLYFSGGLLVFLSLLLPHPDDAFVPGLSESLGSVVVGGTIGIVWARHARAWMVHGVLAAGTFFICLADYFADMAGRCVQRASHAGTATKRSKRSSGERTGRCVSKGQEPGSRKRRATPTAQSCERRERLSTCGNWRPLSDRQMTHAGDRGCLNGVDCI